MSELSQSIARLNRKANTLSRQARESKEQWITLCLPLIETVLRKLREKADKMIQVDPLDLQVLVKRQNVCTGEVKKSLREGKSEIFLSSYSLLSYPCQLLNLLCVRWI